MSSDGNAWKRAIILGLLTGGRSMSGVAALSHYASKHPKQFKGTPVEAMSQEEVATVLKLAAAGELIVDKLPFIPPRTSLLPLLARLAIGAFAGGVSYVGAKQPAYMGAALGALGALVGSYAGYLWRRTAGQLLHLPDLLPALVEDAVVITTGSRLAEQ